MQNCCQGIALLSDESGITLLDRSPFYHTAPVDYLDQAWFLNAVLQIKTILTPDALLCRIKSIQELLGRTSGGVRFGPRILDLDILFFEDRIIDTPDLVVPHPRMHKRRFVLQPFCDIDPTVVHPVLQLSVQDLLNQLVADIQDIKPCSSDC